MIRYLIGDATRPVSDLPEERRFIVHVCNDQGAWGAGFVLAVSRRFPMAEREYRIAFAMDTPPALGTAQRVGVNSTTAVVNMVAQHGFPSHERPCALDYEALRHCLNTVAGWCVGLNASVHMPRIGCGIAGGTWDDIEPIIEQALCALGVPVTVYDLWERA